MLVINEFDHAFAIEQLVFFFSYSCLLAPLYTNTKGSKVNWLTMLFVILEVLTLMVSLADDTSANHHNGYSYTYSGLFRCLPAQKWFNRSRERTLFPDSTTTGFYIHLYWQVTLEWRLRCELLLYIINHKQ